MKNIYVVGEMISHKQGWTEGALESVEKIINKIL
jgi:monoamine oxidase